MNTKQRQALGAVLLSVVFASAGLWAWYAYEIRKIETETQQQIQESVRTFQDCSKQMPGGNLSAKCQEFLGHK